MVTPLSRRRPWVVARQALGLDHLSDGRFILGVGLGAPVNQDFASFGEITDDRTRAARLDESLDLLDRMWSGRKVRHAGTNYQVKDVTFLPRPVQDRIPVWVGGYWPATKPMQRAARWDGVVPGRRGGPMRPADIVDIRSYIDSHRDRDTPYDVVVAGSTPGDDPAAGAKTIVAWEEAGATWWIEDISMWRFRRPGAKDVWPYEEIVERVRQGPPRTD
jgi:alkanesulfonate monooxygenase SsuD/methylene tetrahydromethanopterin reductase-like flavin-dependent oxidoreductase (luciferase family)